MTDILDHHSSQTTKCFIVGKQGTGKTGLLISLVAMGYKLRILDFDNGADILKNLLTSYDYPYRKYMEDHKIPLRGAIDVCTIAEKMKSHSTESRFIPQSSRGWEKMVSMLERWRDKKEDEDLGPVESWGTDVVLCFDTFGTCSDLAFFHTQALNNRLGDRFDEHGRDTGGAQNILKNLVQKIFHPDIKCNVIFNSHITYVDESRGIAQRPRLDGVIEDPTGYPTAIGRALSPVVGKYFNNVLMVEQSGSGQSAKHEIFTVPMKGVSVKTANPAVLKPKYNIETGLAEIFCTLRGEPEPLELIRSCGRSKTTITPISGPQKSSLPR